MKRLFGFLMLATLAFAGCTNDEGVDFGNGSVSIEASIDQPGSRVGFNSTGAFFWTINDAIGVTTTGSTTDFSKMSIAAGDEGTATATFSAKYMSGQPKGYAVYPYNANHKMSGSTLTYNFPASYEYTIEDNDYFVLDGTGNSFNPPMWSAIEDGRVFFKHLGGVLCVKIFDLPAGNDQTLTVTTSNKITGTFTADLSASSPVLTTSASNTDNVVTINYSNAAEADRVFYIPVPAGVYESITVSFEAEGETVVVPFSNKTIKARSLQRLQIGSASIEGGEAAASVAAANKALEQGASSVVIADIAADATDATIVIPEQATADNEVSIEIENIAFDGEIVIDEADGVSNPVAVLNLTLPEDAIDNLVIDMPNTTVYVNGVIVNLTAITAENTLVISEDSEITNLIIKGGNVEILSGASIVSIERAADNADAVTYVYYNNDADIADVVIGEGIVTVLTINDLASLKAFRDAVNAGNTYAGQTVKLGADIDLGGEQWDAIGTEEKNFKGTFDGGNHTIKNLSIVVTEAKEGKAYIGLFGYAKDANFKNLVIENARLNIACLDIDHSQGHIGALVGSLEGNCVIENVTVKGDIKVEATFEANGASRVAVVAGGNSYGNVTMKNVHVIANDGSYLKANNNTGALAGQLQGVNVFENCSSNIDVTVKKFFAGGIIGLAAGDSQFTNCHTTGDVTVTAGREGRANDHYRVGGIAGGWADNVKTPCVLVNCSYTGQVSGTNADGSVAMPLDYAGYVGRGYTLSNRAGSEVVIDGVSYVQAFNDLYGVYIVDGVYEIGTAAALTKLATEVNNGNGFTGKNFKLVADIDLKNVEWTPIGTETNCFMGNFDGNNKVVKNLTVTNLANTYDGYAYIGLFGVTEGSEAQHNYIKNLTIENVTISSTGNIVSAAVAYPYYTDVENITVKGDINIKGGDYTAGVLGYTRRCVVAKNLTIEGNAGSIIEGGTTVGGVISDIQMNGGLVADYSNFKAKGLTIKAIKAVGGMSGIISGQTLDGATVENVAIVCDNIHKGIVSGSLGDKSTISNLSYSNVTGATAVVGAIYNTANPVEARIGDVYYKTFVTDALANVKAGETIQMTHDVIINTTITIAKDKKIVLDMNGHKLSYAVDNDGKASAIFNNLGDLSIVNSAAQESVISFVASDPDLQAIPAYATNTITNEATLYIGKGVTVSNESDGGASYAVDDKGKFVLDGGTLTAKRCALRIAKFNQDDVQFTMNAGSTVKGATPAWVQLPSSNSAVAPKITVVINGGVMQSTKANPDEANVFYTYSYGNSHANTSITINGGEFLGGTVSIGSGYKGDVPSLTINGGTFDHDVVQWLENDQYQVLYQANK